MKEKDESGSEEIDRSHRSKKREIERVEEIELGEEKKDQQGTLHEAIRYINDTEAPSMEISKDSGDSMNRSFERVRKQAEGFRSFDKSRKKRKMQPLRNNQRLVNFLSSSKYSRLVQDHKFLSESRILEELENFESEEATPRYKRQNELSLTNVGINIAPAPS